MYTLINTLGSDDDREYGFSVIGVYATVEEAHEAMIADMHDMATSWANDPAVFISETGEDFTITEKHVYVADGKPTYRDRWTRWQIVGPKEFGRIVWL